MYVSTDTVHEKTADIDHTKDIAYLDELTKDPRKLFNSWNIIKIRLNRA